MGLNTKGLYRHVYIHICACIPIHMRMRALLQSSYRIHVLRTYQKLTMALQGAFRLRTTGTTPAQSGHATACGVAAWVYLNSLGTLYVGQYLRVMGLSIGATWEFGIVLK